MLQVVPKDMVMMQNFLRQKGYIPVTSADMLQLGVKNSLEAFALLKEMEGQFRSFEVHQSSMDTLFINITGHTIRDGD
jgi:hypothetical protein